MSLYHQPGGPTPSTPSDARVVIDSERELFWVKTGGHWQKPVNYGFEVVFMDAPDRDMAEWQGKADRIFEALLDCLDRNYEDEMQRLEAQKYILHKYVWDMTVDSDRANEVLRIVTRGD